MRIKCNCISEFQDKRYGVNIRIGNPCKIQNGKPTKARCTVCGREDILTEQKERK